MIKKLYKITTAYEDGGGYNANMDSFTVLAETAEKAIKKIKNKIAKAEFVDKIENLGVAEIE